MIRVIERELVEGMATDLMANAGLDPVPITVVRGRRPRAIMPSDCPCLVVWIGDKPLVPQGTERFHSMLQIGVSYHEEAVAEAVTLMDDEELSWSLVTNLKRIEARARLWAVDTTGLLGIEPPATVADPSVYEALPAGWERVEYEDGLTEGYALLVVVDLTESAGA